jgi:5'-nucleotidase
MKKILVTNDDGIQSDGIIRLAALAKSYGEVWVIAPDSQRSAMSHSTTFHKSVEMQEVDFAVSGVHAYASSGTPADCVRIGILNMIPGKPDYVFSGINNELNIASDLQYSATIGAALEAAYLKVPAIAFSEADVRAHEVTDYYLPEVTSRLMGLPLGRNEIWNVNFPSCDLSTCNGILYDRTVSVDDFYTEHYRETVLADGKTAYMVEAIRHWRATKGTDLCAIIDHYVSVGKVRNLT